MYGQAVLLVDEPAWFLGPIVPGKPNGGAPIVRDVDVLLDEGSQSAISTEVPDIPETKSRVLSIGPLRAQPEPDEQKQLITDIGDRVVHLAEHTHVTRREIGDELRHRVMALVTKET